MGSEHGVKGLVSIGLPTYNRPEALRRCLEMISAQTYKNLEVIVSDNASEDAGVKEIAEDFARKDPRIKYFRQERNLGLLVNTEFVLQKAAGEYFTWISDDDWRSPEFIELLVAELEKRADINLAFCDYHEVHDDGSRALEYPATHLSVFKPFQSPSRLVRTLSYYLQDAFRGKCNLFYSLFRRAPLAALDFREISGGYGNINTDSLLVFNMLQKGPAIIVPEAMCTLTCGNKKHYAGDFGGLPGKGLGFLCAFTAIWDEHKRDAALFIKNSGLPTEKFFIAAAFLPRFAALLAKAALKKFSRACAEETRIEVSAPRALHLPNVTLVAMATRNVEETLSGMEHSCRGVKFGAVKLLSHYSPPGMVRIPELEFVRIGKVKDIDEWSRQIIYDLGAHIKTEFALLVHADGFVVNPSSWRKEFLDYDYIGAPWPLPTDDFSYRDVNGNIVRVGNSVSLRSKRLLDLPVKLKLPWEPFHGYYNEDGFICVKNKHIYEANGMKFAPLDAAKYFSHEAMIPEVKGIKPFVFHKWAGTNGAYPRYKAGVQC